MHLAVVEPRAEDEVQDQERRTAPEHHDRDQRISLAGARAASEAAPAAAEAAASAAPAESAAAGARLGEEKDEQVIGGQHRTRIRAKKPC